MNSSQDYELPFDLLSQVIQDYLEPNTEENLNTQLNYFKQESTEQEKEQCTKQSQNQEISVKKEQQQQ